MSLTRGAIIVAIAGALLIAVGQYKGNVPILQGDAVSEAFDEYEAMWRQNALRAAEKIEGNTLTTDTDVREYLSRSNQEARKRAFDAIAKAEAARLSPWTAELHIKVLREYAP